MSAPQAISGSAIQTAAKSAPLSEGPSAAARLRGTAVKLAAAGDLQAQVPNQHRAGRVQLVDLNFQRHCCFVCPAIMTAFARLFRDEHRCAKPACPIAKINESTNESFCAAGASMQYRMVPGQLYGDIYEQHSAS